MIFYHTHVPVFLNGDTLKAPRFLANEVNALSGRGEDIYLLVYSAKGNEVLECKSSISQEVRYHIISEHYSVPKRLFIGLFKIVKILRIINTYSDPIILIKGPTPLLLILFPLNYSKRVYLFLVGDYTQNIGSLKFGKLKNFGVRLLAFSVDFFIMTRFRKAYLLANSQIILDKYANCFNKSELVRTSTIERSDIVLERNYSKDKFVILFVGRVDFTKGVDELVKSFKICFEAGIASELKIIGPIVENGINVKTKIEFDHGDEEFMNHVNFVGPVFNDDSLKKIYLESDVFVLPSKAEGFPRVFWEAFSCGLPVVTTRVGGIPRVLTHEVDSLLLERGDAEEIFDAILQLYTDRELFGNLVRNSQNLAFENTVDKQVDNMLSVFYER